MTRLFNLESYPELCSYAHLYETEIETLIPQNSFPSAYKNFLDKYKDRGYCADSVYPQELSLKDEPISFKNLGIYLSEKDKNIYVVPDKIKLLDLKNLLKSEESYIYKSAYYYWNYLEQITKNLDLNKPVIFIDLNSFSNESYCSLQFVPHQNSPYLVPIINKKNEPIKELKLVLNPVNIYNNIYHNLAQKIIEHNFSQIVDDEKAVNSLKIYLQKLGIFQIAQSQSNQDNFSIIIEITTQGKTYYKSVNLNIAFLEDVVLTEIDCKSISQFTKNNQEFSFILISDYNVLPKFRHTLNSSNLFLPDTRFSQFPQLWLEKQQQNFPWFGQYLDQIKFQIKRPSGETQWIEVLSTEEQEHIYYEGDPEIKPFIACIPETGQNDFKLLYPHTILPIQINDRDYCINGISQVYEITHPWEELKAKSEELRARIEFMVKPGSAPELRVRDKDYKYTIAAKWRDRSVITQTFSCIPLKTILENRQKQLDSNIPNQKEYQDIINCLSQISKINNINEISQIKIPIKKASQTLANYKRRNQKDLFLNVKPNHSFLQNLKTNLNNLGHSGLINLTINYLNNIHSPFNEERKTIFLNLINFLGRTYRLSEEIITKDFFSATTIKQACQTSKIGKQYFIVLSKLSFKQEFQLSYLNIFSQQLYQNLKSYQIDDYLWGYSRILLWYSNFYHQYNKDQFDYVGHFREISSYLLANSQNTRNTSFNNYKQNAFLSLIYLLTFREADSQFCTSESEEYKLAEQIVEKYRNECIRLKSMGSKSLNEYFEELLKGNCSEGDFDPILPVD